MFLIYEATGSVILGIYDSMDDAIDFVDDYEAEDCDELYVYELEMNKRINVFMDGKCFYKRIVPMGSK